MAFEDRLTASVRGVEFLLEETEGTSGRRAIPHAYPKKESGFTEDNGKVLTQERITARVVGLNYVNQLSALLDALNAPGPCELIHPWFGIRQVQIGNVTHRLVNRVDLTATLTFEVFEAGQNLFPSTRTATVIDLQAQVGEAWADAYRAYAKLVKPSAVKGIGDMVDQFLDDLDEFTRSLPHMPKAMSEWASRLERAKSSVGRLLAYPGRLASETMTVMESVKSVCTDPIRSLSVYDSVKRRWDGMRAELAVTGGLSRNIVSANGQASSVSSVSNQSELADILSNAQAFNQLVAVSAAISKASALGDATVSYQLTDEEMTIESLSGSERQALLTGQQLKSIGYQLAAELAELAELAVERGDSELWRRLRLLRKAVLDDVRERAELLPSLVLCTPTTTLPVALLSWQKTGSAENRNSIVRRNGLSNPAFITPNDTIEVING